MGGSTPLQTRCDLGCGRRARFKLLDAPPKNPGVRRIAVQEGN